MDQDPENDRAVKELVRIATRGFCEENSKLSAVGSSIHETADSIFLAWREDVYSYLIRRSLALSGSFLWEISYEEAYPTKPYQHVDLLLKLLDGGNKERCAIELKWVTEHSANSVYKVATDVKKLLDETEFDSRYLLLFPLYDGNGIRRNIDLQQYLDILGKRVRDLWPDMLRPVLRPVATDCFRFQHKGGEIEFRLAAVAVEPGI